MWLSPKPGSLVRRHSMTDSDCCAVQCRAQTSGGSLPLLRKKSHELTAWVSPSFDSWDPSSPPAAAAHDIFPAVKKQKLDASAKGSSVTTLRWVMERMTPERLLNRNNQIELARWFLKFRSFTVCTFFTRIDMLTLEKIISNELGCNG